MALETDELMGSVTGLGAALITSKAAACLVSLRTFMVSFRL
jgi:hypothetical protein